MKSLIKKTLLCVVTACLFINMLPISISAAQKQKSVCNPDDYLYEVLDDGTLMITSYEGSDTVITVPSKINGKKVTVIGEDSFRNDYRLKSVTFPSTITVIQHCAFIVCTALEEVNFSENLKNIGTASFNYCTSLKSINIPDSVVSIGARAFEDCFELAEISLGKNISCIQESAFENTAYYGDKKNWIDEVLYIDNWAITVNKKSIKKAAIKSGTVGIADQAFYGCKRLKSIKLPDSIMHIGVQAFEDTLYYNNAKNWDKGVLYIDNYLIYAEAQVSPEIKSGTKCIADSAFENCIIKHLNIPDGCKSIGNNIMGDYEYYLYSNNTFFKKCKELTEIVMPYSLRYIGRNDFSEYENINKIIYKGTKNSWKKISENIKFSNSKISYQTSNDLKITKVSASSKDNNIVIKWTASEKATKYAILKYVNGKWKIIKKTEKTSYIDSDVKTKKTYKYKVIPYIDEIQGSTSKTVTIIHK